MQRDISRVSKDHESYFHAPLYIVCVNHQSAFPRQNALLFYLSSKKDIFTQTIDSWMKPIHDCFYFEIHG